MPRIEGSRCLDREILMKNQSSLELSSKKAVLKQCYTMIWQTRWKFLLKTFKRETTQSHSTWEVISWSILSNNQAAWFSTPSERLDFIGWTLTNFRNLDVNPKWWISNKLCLNQGLFLQNPEIPYKYLRPNLRLKSVKSREPWGLMISSRL